jgi:hypothetical protein
MTGISLLAKSYYDGFESQRRVLDVQAGFRVAKRALNKFVSGESPPKECNKQMLSLVAKVGLASIS